MRGRLILLFFLALVTALRWAVLAPQELSASDSYLALCGEAPDVATFDGPAGVPLLVHAGIKLAGASALGARLAWPLLAFWATVAVYLLIARIADKRAALAGAAALNLFPAFNTAALEATPALPVALFALSFAACAWRALENDSAVWWLASGLSAAAALFFSYSAWLLVPALAVVLCASHRWRKQLLLPGFWMSALAPAIVLALLLHWNSTHGWVHFIGQTLRSSLSLHWAQSFRILTDIARDFTPFFAPCLIAAICLALVQSSASRRAKFLLVPALAASIQAAYVALRGGTAHTEMLLAGTLTVPLLSWIPGYIGKWRVQGLVVAAYPAAAVWTALALAVGQPPPAKISGESVEAIEKLRLEQSATTGTPVFLIAENALLASSIALRLKDSTFAVPGHPSVYVLESPYADSQFALWPRYDQFVDAPRQAALEGADPFTEQSGTNLFIGRSALFVGTAAPGNLPQAVTAAFGAVRLVAEIETAPGQILRIYLCSDYSTLPL
ncbi:MAG: glycosyltransferase family 39 protein [Chthoniobacterales bacterium]|nr:glycosyltransferase family 39 protein [Chthoniobacterales bacterium]